MKKIFISLLSLLLFSFTKNELKFDSYDVFNQKNKLEKNYIFVKLTGNVDKNIKESVLENLMNIKSKTKNVKFVFSEKDIINSNYTLEINIDSVTISPEKINTKEHIYNSAIREERTNLISRIESYEQNYVYTGQIQGRITVFSKSKSSQIITTVKLLKNDITVKTDVVKGEYYFFYNYAKREGVYPYEFNQRFPYSSKDKDFMNDNEMIKKTITDLNKKLKKVSSQ